jgi:hypothetical protein
MKFSVVPRPDQRSFPVVVDQIRTNPEFVPLATRFPCGEKATDVTPAGPELVAGPPQDWPVMTTGRPGTWEST